MLALATIAFNKPRAVEEQIRLTRKYLLDEHRLIVVDNSEDPWRYMIERLCITTKVPYVRSPSYKHQHHEALNYAASLLVDADFMGFLDHDVYPVKPTRLLPLIEPAGFYGLGQTHRPTGAQYLWPGFCFFAKSWLAGRPLDFGGIRGVRKEDDGDTGSLLHTLFSEQDWQRLAGMKHGYHALRPPDDYGLQSWGYEQLGDWLHASNGSGWMAIPRPEERERLWSELLGRL